MRLRWFVISAIVSSSALAQTAQQLPTSLPQLAAILPSLVQTKQFQLGPFSNAVFTAVRKDPSSAPLAVAISAKNLRKPDPKVRRWTLLLLWAIAATPQGPRELEPVDNQIAHILIQGDDSQQRVALLIASTLKHNAPESFIAPLEKLVQAPNVSGTIRERAANALALARPKDDGAQNTIVNAINDSSLAPNVRSAMISYTAPPDAGSIITDNAVRLANTSTNKDIRDSAISAVTNIGPDAVMRIKDRLIAIQNNPKESLSSHQTASAALRSLHGPGQSGVPFPHRWFVRYSDRLKRAAQAGDPESQTALGVAYLQANGIQRSSTQAVFWLQKAYKQGDADAAAWLGSLYLAGEGVPANITKGLALIHKAQANGSAVGTRFAAAATEKGIGQPADMRKALEIYQLAVIELDPVARDRMGQAYQEGRYRPRNLNEAAILYSEAAKQGDPWAQLHLGELYASDLPFMDPREHRMKENEPWPSEAYAMYVLSGDAGNRVAAYRTAEALVRGEGADQDFNAAETWFNQSARQGYGPAQKALADLYLQHPEIAHTKVEVYVLLKRAAANGQQGASAEAQTLEKRMPPAALRLAKDQLAGAPAHEK